MVGGLAANALAADIVRTVAGSGAVSATLNLFHISAVIYLAIAAALTLLWSAPDVSLTRADLIVVSTCMVCVLFPVPETSKLALTGMAIYLIGTGAPRSPVRRAGTIVLSVAASILWGKLFLELESRHLLGFEAAVVSLFTGSGGSGNVVNFVGGAGRMLVMPACSSLHGVSIAVVLWVTAYAWLDLRPMRRGWACLAAMVLAAIGLNVARLVAMAMLPARFEDIHAGVGATVFSWLSLIAIAALVSFGVTRDQARAA